MPNAAELLIVALASGAIFSLVKLKTLARWAARVHLGIENRFKRSTQK